MIALFTDFGRDGPYVGQMKAVLLRQAPGVELLDLMHDAPARDPRASAYLLAALVDVFPQDAVFLAVVDPGVGGPRRAAAVQIDGRWFVGPDNGLFNVLARRGSQVEWWDITWRPERLSSSFHGRDLFAPVAAAIARGDSPPGERVAVEERVQPDWPEQLREVIYIDHFGNAMTGISASAISGEMTLQIGGTGLRRARTFSDVAPGQGFWYENSSGLVELAVNGGRADATLGLRLGDEVNVGQP